MTEKLLECAMRFGRPVERAMRSPSEGPLEYIDKAIWSLKGVISSSACLPKSHGHS